MPLCSEIVTPATDSELEVLAEIARRRKLVGLDDPKALADQVRELSERYNAEG